jgi:lipopolysaccharide/colanic/teichoic acid biosynthesis glycosyltransferase
MIATYQFWKKIGDRLAALAILIVSLPLIALIALAIRIDSPGSPIFSQQRVGRDGRPFVAYKFRTMYANNDDAQYQAYLREYILENRPYAVDGEGNQVFKVVNDSRVTSFGAVLRSTNLDELPQILNVVKGDMSLVGPRPDIPVAVAMYSEKHMARLQAIPGITGLWQVSRRNCCSFEEMIDLDLEYVRRQSLLLDLKILLRTAAVILGRDGSEVRKKGDPA